jgi:hypothetical protein
MGNSIDKAISSSVKRYSESELKEACLDETKAKNLAAKVFFQLPERIKKNFNADTKTAFINDVTARLMKAKDTKKGKKKILGE